MDIRYPAPKCLHPQQIINPYTDELMLVPCGKCEACRLNKSYRSAFFCDLEAKSNTFTVFITLTYDNDNIPRVDFTSSDKMRDFEYGDFLSELRLPVSELQPLLKKFELGGDIPYLRKIDLQNFFKRLRYYVCKRFPSEKVRYFACGEYGPVHFRPHYHVLLFFNSRELLQVLTEIVRSSWKLGRIDCQLSKGKCSSYVASYVNSYNFVPEILRAGSVCPFVVHSSKLGQGVLQGQRTEVYQMEFDRFIKRSLEVNGKYREFEVPSSCYSYYFPKCKGFVNKSSRELLYSYTVYHEALQQFPGFSSTAALARGIASYIYCFHGEPDSYSLDLFGSYDYKQLGKLDTYFYEPGVRDFSVNSPDYAKWVNRIYTELLLSKHFLHFVCDRFTLSDIKRKIKMIQDFYSKLESLRLFQFFEKQRMFYDSDLYGSDDLLTDEFDNDYYPYFYDNVYFDPLKLSVTPVYRNYEADIIKLYRDRVKHKKLNDTNRLLYDK